MAASALACIAIGAFSAGISNWKGGGDFDWKGFAIDSAFAVVGGVAGGKFACSFTNSAIARAADMKGGLLASTLTAQKFAVTNLIGVTGLGGGLATCSLFEGDGNG